MLFRSPHTGVIVSVSQGSENSLVKTTTGIETNQRGLLTVNEDGSTTREGVFAGGDAVMGARTVVEAVAIAKKVAESMDAYMKSLPADNTPDPYADIPVFSTPTSDVLAKMKSVWASGIFSLTMPSPGPRPKRLPFSKASIAFLT